ncbi:MULTISPECIES: YesL family protein [Streptococcus]|uniref:YesL family protein n=1 Tax=Streptococcus TaxID=1301 RepID=UPI0029C1B38A|nr:YesL family protein [Streptococcus anginosus]MDX5004322.1 YesL family protein [Streptococcus anginosus]MDX5025848.1 YesL family protein [Streptococcus anginosus]MDX5033738.1 YesL family protein [Streptococcus anginosus]MDX5100875.1 YesL family protein [Streptococcus anginosus]
MEKRGSQLIQSIFDTDNFFMRICEKILDLVTVNLLFLLSCLPIVTIGIAKMSLYQTLFVIKDSRRVKVTATYVQAFRKNWKIGFKLGLLELLIVGISLFDLMLFWRQETLPFQMLKATCIGVIIFTSLLFLCIYPLAVKFEMTTKDMLQTGLIMVSLHFPWFFLMIALLAAIIFFLSSSGFVLLLGFTLFVLVGFAALGFLQLPIMETIFNKYKR